MKAVVYETFNTPPAITTVPDPTPDTKGVVLRVEATGVCRSDWHAWVGHEPDIALPHVPGHEMAGVVESVGRDVTRWRVGDRVTVPFVLGCGACPECHDGDQQVCSDQRQPGFTQWGSFAEYVALDRADINLVALPEAVNFATAASFGCRFATAFRAVLDQGRTRAGEWVAVHGCGGVGLSAIMIARAVGARVVAVDIARDKLDLARAFGAEVMIDGGSVGSVPEAIADATGGGAHVSLDALGATVTCVNSVLGLRRRGRHVQVGLMLGDHTTPPVPMDRVISHELEILGSHGMQAHRYGAMLSMVEAGMLAPDRLIGREISLRESISALMEMDSFQAVGATVVTDFS